MTTNTVVVASNVPGLRDSVRDGETGLLFEYGDLDGLDVREGLQARFDRPHPASARIRGAWSRR